LPRSQKSEEELRRKKQLNLPKNNRQYSDMKMKQVNTKSTLPSGEIEIRVSSEAQVNTKLSVSYLVSNAGWYPKYDIRVENVKAHWNLIIKRKYFKARASTGKM